MNYTENSQSQIDEFNSTVDPLTKRNLEVPLSKLKAIEFAKKPSKIVIGLSGMAGAYVGLMAGIGALSLLNEDGKSDPTDCSMILGGGFLILTTIGGTATGIALADRDSHVIIRFRQKDNPRH